MDSNSTQHQKDFLNSFLNQDAQMSTIFPPFLSSPPGGPNSGSGAAESPRPQSPNSQLAMSLFNNLIQMQGLENNIVQNQLASSMAGQASSNASSNTPHRSEFAASQAPSYNSQMLEQRIKLSQLQQLQQLQNQIFQQQIALISGQSPSILPTSPLIDPSRQLAGGGGTVGDQYTGLPTPGPSGEIRPMEFVSSSAMGNYMDPLPRALVPPSSNTPSQSHIHSQSHQRSQEHSPNPNTMHHHHQSSSSHSRQPSGSGQINLSLQRQLQALAQQPQHRQPHSPYDSPSLSTFQQQQHQQQHQRQHLPSSPVYHPTSPMHNPVSPMHPPTSPDSFGAHQRHHGYPTQHHQSRLNQSSSPQSMGSLSAPHSAPERMAFNIYTGPLPGNGGSTIPGLTLGPAGAPLGVDAMQAHSNMARRMSLSSAPQQGQRDLHSISIPMHILDQDISPLTSPWLGAHQTSPTSAGGGGGGGSTRVSTRRSSGSTSNSNKRAASSSGDEGGSARKKQSPAIRPTLGMSAVSMVAEDRESSIRETGSTSPLGLGEGRLAVGRKNTSNPNSKGSTPPPLEGGGGGGHNSSGNLNSMASSSSSRCGSGSVSPALSSSKSGGNHHYQHSHSAASAMPANASGSTSDTILNRRRSSSSVRLQRHQGSKSTHSTPLLRGTPALRAMTRSSSRTASTSDASTVPNGLDVVHDSPSPVDLNLEGDMGCVDRSMPPPPLPVNRTGEDGIAINNNNNGSSNNNNTNHNGVGLGMNVDMNEMNMGMGEMMNMDGMNMGFGGEMGNGEMGMDMGMMNMNMNLNMDMGMGMGVGGMGGMDGMGGFGGMDFGQQAHQQHQHQQHQQQHVHHQQQEHQHQHQHQPSQQHQHMLPPSSSSSGSPTIRVGNGGDHQPILPVTPASIMNLGRLGISTSPGGSGRLGSNAGSSSSSSQTTPANVNAPTNTTGSRTRASSSSTTRSNKRKDSAATTAAAAGVAGMPTRSGRTTRRTNALSSPSLKPLLPAGTMTPSMDPTLPVSIATSNSPALPMSANLSSGNTTTGSVGPTMHVRKTSHKAAEQKRRDSLKTTFDNLRKLLPPIALPNDADVDPSMITSPLFHPTAPLLPGALPPRGPPKAGGEGPNKGVSKLQLLICGNEYIRLLKGRVERRDEEVERLREEVRRLRVVVEERGGEEEESLDLERDLDAVERTGYHHHHHASSSEKGVGGLKNGMSSSGVVAAGGDDVMEEGDDEDDE